MERIRDVLGSRAFAEEHLVRPPSLFDKVVFLSVEKLFIASSNFGSASAALTVSTEACSPAFFRRARILFTLFTMSSKVVLGGSCWRLFGIDCYEQAVVVVDVPNGMYGDGGG